jgi:steroid delta-isomerase-like uncharacterized protein
MSDQNKSTARRLYEEIITKGNLDAIKEVFTADYQDHDPANEEETRGHDGVRQEVEMYRSAFPDLQMTVEDQLAEGDQVVTRWTVRATHQGVLMDMAATGNKVTMTGITIHRFADGKIQEGWWNWDALGMLRQVGAIPEEQPA